LLATNVHALTMFLEPGSFRFVGSSQWAGRGRLTEATKNEPENWTCSNI
jgi:hypothetical protein